LGGLRRDAFATGKDFEKRNSPLFEIASVFVRFKHVASFIVNANHSIV
jgi:hypothetical protein